MTETIYGAQLEVIENAGHMVMIEAPGEVNEAIQKFLDQDSSTRGKRSRLDVTRGTVKSTQVVNKPVVDPDNSASCVHGRSATTADTMEPTSVVDIQSTDYQQQTSRDSSFRQRCGSRMSRPSTASKRAGKKMF